MSSMLSSNLRDPLLSFRIVTVKCIKYICLSLNRVGRVCHMTFCLRPPRGRSGLRHYNRSDFTSNLQPVLIENRPPLFFFLSVPAINLLRDSLNSLSWNWQYWHAPIPIHSWLTCDDLHLVPGGILTSRRGVVVYAARPESGEISIYVSLPCYVLWFCLEERMCSPTSLLY